MIATADDLPAVDGATMTAVGWCHHRLGQHDEAARLFARVEALAPNLLVVPFNLALATLCLGEKRAAQREYERALAIAGARADDVRRAGLRMEVLRDLDEAARDYPDLREDFAKVGARVTAGLAEPATASL